MPIAASELILTSKNRIYHVNLRPEELAQTVITVGDPDRVPLVSRYFDEIEFKIAHRELITHTGYLNGKRLSVISTGMGTPNIDIVINELDALVNIDFETREVKSKPVSLDIIRLGTAGGLQADVPLGALAITDCAIGFDNLMCFYKQNITTEEQAIRSELINHFNPSLPCDPYVVSSEKSLVNDLQLDGVHGMTATCPGFYGPQNRVLRGSVVLENFLDQLSQFRYQQMPVVNFEMETSAIYGMAKLLGHRACSVSAVIANRQTGEFDPNMSENVDRMIQTVLEKITALKS